MIRMLIAEDKEAMRRSLVRLFSEKGHEVIEAGSGAEALERFNEMEIDLVITDLQMGEVGGLEVLREVKKRAPQTPVLMVTAFGTVESAVEAMRQGAFDYLVKPFSLTEIEARVEKALEQRRLLTENRYLRETLDHAVGRMIGRSERMQQVYRLIEKVAPHPSPVLILGETGTGKELVAREIQQMGPRKTGPFIAVNCGAIPENLLESELFGYEKGAFTGASAQKKGRLELAEGGPSSSMRSGSFLLPFRSSSCGFYRSGKFSGWGDKNHPGRCPVDRRDEPRFKEGNPGTSLQRGSLLSNPGD
ncbi:MAG: sigma-54 dependent transcriptional regulator (plasmid) [Candidatus Manganitrophus sp.]|nr:MAG: sigma-54 dependent transcriptional regulator [Candidatus Manganitrophus sp.]